MVKYGETSWLLGIVGLLALALFLAFFSGLIGPLIKLALARAQLALFLIPALWVSKDLVVEKIFGGFPWCLAGYSQYRHTYFSQLAEWGGIHLLTFLLVFFNLLLYRLLRQRKQRWLWLFVGSLVMVEMTGFFLFKNAKQEMNRMPWQRAGILQPNITHDITFDSASSNSQLKELFEISIRLQSQGAEFIVWPEYTVPIYPLQTPFFRKQFSEFSTRHLPLLAGFTDFRSSEEVYNAAILFDGTRLSQYNKVHLTPFGEYVLFRKALFFVKKITDEIGDFTPGQQVDTLSLNRHRIATPICYEIIYPELVRLFVTRGAELIVTISNDSWFGQSWAPFQHLSMAVIRAIENRRYVLRSTSNGISATIEPTGQFQHRSPLAASDFFISRFHYLSRRTLFSSSGYLFPYLVMLGCVLYYGGNLLYRGWQRLHQPPKS